MLMLQPALPWLSPHLLMNRALLFPKDEKELILWMDMMGRFGDAPTKEECEWMVLGAIHARNELFKKDFRKARQPSKLALKALKNKKVERRFWTRLEARHPALKFGQGKAFACAGPHLVS
eukprot:m.224355 g.224355  ORF g.224355 m.224355 type:complete len:120 (-) comp15650_c1_seq3:2264-2623(-)